MTAGMNKYEIAARLAAHGLDDGRIDDFLVLNSGGDSFSLDDLINDLAGEQRKSEASAARLLEDCNAVREVLREIQAAENPAPGDARRLRYASGEEARDGDKVALEGSHLGERLTVIRPKRGITYVQHRSSSGNRTIFSVPVSSLILVLRCSPTEGAK